MRLALVQDLLDELGYDSNLVNITKAVGAALDTATARLASVLRTDFRQVSIVDMFYVNEMTRLSQGAGFYTKVCLSHGFLTASPALVALASSSMPDIASGNTVNVTSQMLLALEKGVALDAYTDYTQKWLRFTYTKGFPVSGGDALTYDTTVVPNWLQIAAKLHAKMSLVSNPSLEDAKISMDIKAIQREFTDVIHGHLRYAPDCITPVLSSVGDSMVQPTATSALAVP